MPDTKLTVEPPKPLGRPSDYSQATADYICACISNGMSIRQIIQYSKTPEGIKELKELGISHIPAQGTIYVWLFRFPAFQEQYARAREEQADTLADEILAIADETPEMNPIIDKRTGELIEMQMHSAYIQWQKNRIDARKWTAMKLRPKKYGEMVRQNIEEVQGDVVDVTAKEVLTSIVSNIEMKRQLQNAG
jgi:hypothetical protein